MKIKELLIENYTAELETTLNDILAAAKGQGLDNISTDVLVQQMQSMGYEVSVNSIMALLQDNPFVVSATPDSVDLEPVDGAGVMGDEDTSANSEDRVDQMAQQGL